MQGPRSMDTGSYAPMSLQHRSSTKQLIGRFELMNQTILSAESPIYPHPLAASKKTLPFLSQRTDKLPIRQSFRNLFSVFKKATNINTKDKLRDDTIAKSSGLEKFPKVSPLPISNTRPTPRTPTGPLLYLFHPPRDSSTPTITPVWLECTVSLENNRITISSSTHGDHIIHLSCCTDIRSLSTQQNDSREKTLPSKLNIDQFKVFEILFEGRAREKFAAKSVRERAGWISSIWDVILFLQENKSTDDRRGQDLTVNHRTRESLDVSSSSPLENSTTPLSSLPDSERALPPIPLPKERRSHSDSLEVQELTNKMGVPFPPNVSPASVYSPPQSLSRASSEAQSRCNSPSILNLGRLSVVRQRLAQMEQNTSQSPCPGFASPLPPSRGFQSNHLSTPVFHPEAMLNPYDSLESKRMNPTKTSSVESLLDSYGDAKRSLYDPELCAGSQQTSANSVIDPPMKYFAELLHEHSIKSYDLTEKLGDQIISLQNEVQLLPRMIASVISNEDGYMDMQKIISSLEKKTSANAAALINIQEKLEAVEERWGMNSTTVPDYITHVLDTLTTIQQQLGSELPAILTRLDRVEEGCKSPGEKLGVLQTPTFSNDYAEPSRSNFGTFCSVTDLSKLHTKLDNLMALYDSNLASPRSSTELKDLKTKLTMAIGLLEESKCQGALQSAQQADSVRYLNELNAWLEAFVNNGTSQIQSLVTSIDQISRYLDCGSRPDDNESFGFFKGPHQLMPNLPARNQGTPGLRTSIDALLTIVTEGSHKALNVESLAIVFDHHRREQEGLFRALSHEISNEIRGERLRFVDAMKEATAINVQIHVEQFKKELSREVLGMTEEVKRLHKERQLMENQIADLFAFYTKQKEAIGAPPPDKVHAPVPVMSQQEFLVSARQRPLPYPKIL